MRFLLDANVLSEGTKRRPDAGLVTWLEQHEASSVISDLTIGELTKGVFNMPLGKRRDRLLVWIEELEEAFGERILPVSLDVFKQWGRLCGQHESQGRRWPLLDSLLAASALVYDLSIVTRNTMDFPPEVRTLNPWKK